MAAQDQALRKNVIKSQIDKQDVSPVYRMCGKHEETIAHVVANVKNWLRTSTRIGVMIELGG